MKRAIPLPVAVARKFNRPLTLDQAQELDDVFLRPSHVQRYAGRDSPLQKVVGIGGHGPVGRLLLLGCGHWREIRDWDLGRLVGNKPEQRQARCGLCRLGYEPEPPDLARATALSSKKS